MNSAWDFKKDDVRTSDSLFNFIIFCEDEVSEPIYFKYFETSLIKVNNIPCKKGKIDNVLKAICHCKENGLMDSNGESMCISTDDTQVWCVFDRDIEVGDSEIKMGNIAFDEAIKTANSRGIKVAWSNDAFELWVLLHFMEIDLFNDDFKNRNKYYDQLTEFFKALPNPNEDLVKALSHVSFNYKKDFKHANNFRNIVREEMVGKTQIAIERANNLEGYFDTLEIPNHEKSPCTLVHHLVLELIRLGGKVPPTTP